MSHESLTRSAPSFPNSIRKQRGVTLISFFIYILFGVMLLLVCLKVLPAYMENVKIQSILDGVSEDFSSGSGATKAVIKKKLAKRFILDSVNAIEANDIEIERDGEFWLIDAGYEKRVNLISNIDIVVNFTESNKLQIPYGR